MIVSLMKQIIFILILLISFPFFAFSAKTPFGKALWIGATTNKDDSLAGRSIVVGKDVKLKGKVVKAEVNICGLGSYELYINKQKVGNDMMTPAWSDYRKTVFYNIYDITDMLRSKKADICVLLGNSFYHEEGKRYHKLTSNFGPLTLLFCLHIIYSDGKEENIISDNTWNWAQSPVTYNSIYGGEDYDDRIPMFGKRKNRVVVQRSPLGRLRKQLSYPVRIMERYNISKRLQGMVFDMGQNLAGFPEITVTGKSGQSVVVWVGETLTKDGIVSQKQTGKPYFYKLTIGRSGRLTWHPHFSYNGFQYIHIDGAVMKGDENHLHLPVVESLQSCFIYSSAPKTGNFVSSNERWNATYRIIDRAIRSNWQNVWTDCPQREKLGWLEQDWLNGPGLVSNYDCRSMIEQTMIQISDAQHDDGSMPEIAPEYIKFVGSWAPPFQESPEWGGALVALPFLYKQAYASDSLITQYLPNMVRYVDYLATRDSSYILNMGLGDWYDYGPWKAGLSRNTPVALVATAHYYLWTKLTAKAALIEYKKNGKESYKLLSDNLFLRADSIRDHFNSTFYSPQKHTYGTGSQASNAIPLYMGIVPDSLANDVMASIVKDIRSHGNRLTTGDIGSPYLYALLIDRGYGDLLADMLDHDSLPGYGYIIKHGMTTLTEQWNPAMGASRNHFMLGHINNHLVPDIAGIRFDDGVITIAPHPIKGITWVNADREGVKVEWQKQNGNFHISITLPPDYHATVVMPYSGKKFKIHGAWNGEEDVEEPPSQIDE